MTASTVGPAVGSVGAGVNGSGRMVAGPVGTPLPTRQRNNGFVALAVALIVGLAAIGAYLYSSAGSKTLVVMVVDEVAAGQVIERSDLTTVPVSGRVTAYGADRLDGLVGQRARVTLLPDMFLQRSMVKDSGESLPAGQAEVGVAVRSGQIPADGLAPGDTVQIVQLPAQDAAGQARVLVEQARVFSSRPDESVVGGTVLTVVVPVGSSTAVAAASGAGQVALVRVPGP